jgi:hypothetical protein
MSKNTIIKIILAFVAIIVVKKGVSFVYDKIQVMNAPTMQEISEANPWTVPADWFKTDTITIKGRIEDYDAEQFGFTSMACYYTDVFEKGSTVLVLDIAGERTKEGSDAYKQYVAEWLANEETVCLTNAEFRRLQELFQFNGIPHYETITPDGRRVREDLSISGYHDFENELQKVLVKLK